MSVSVSSPCCSLWDVRRLAGLLRWHCGGNGEGHIMDEKPTCRRLPPEPTWKSVYGHNGKVTYDLHWLQTNALNWHTFVDSDKVMLNYLSSYEMPLAESPALTQ